MCVCVGYNWDGFDNEIEPRTNRMEIGKRRVYSMCVTLRKTVVIVMVTHVDGAVVSWSFSFLIKSSGGNESVETEVFVSRSPTGRSFFRHRYIVVARDASFVSIV